MSVAAEPLTVERVYPAPAAELYRAWLEPERLLRWFEPLAGSRAETARVDPRPGGELLLRYALEGGALAMRGRFRELVPDRRLVFELALVWGEAAPGAPSLVTVELEPRGEDTRLVLRQEGLPPDQRQPFAAAWQHGLGRLASECATLLDAFEERLSRYPRFHSRFGGFWPDLTDAETRLAGKRALGLLTDQDAALFRHWIAKGYVVLEGAVDTALVDRLRDEIRRTWERGDPRVTIELWEGGRLFQPLEPRFRDVPHKVLDYHAVSALAREVQFAPAIRRFLGQLFERPPMAFQSLLFRWGTEQDMHQDTAYVVVRSPMEFVGCWVALEDIAEGTGELQYYDGSHRIPEYVWFGRSRAKPHEYDDDRDFLRHVREESERAGLPLTRFRPRKGDALVWHADLVHGGGPRAPGCGTRWSLVTHYCPVDVDPEWMDRVPSSGRLEHLPGCFYCHPLRGTERAATGG